MARGRLHAGRGRGPSRPETRHAHRPFAGAARPTGVARPGTAHRGGRRRPASSATSCSRSEDNETVGAETAQVIVEVAEPRAQHEAGNASRSGAAAEPLDAVPAGRVGIGRDVEAPAVGRQDKAREMIGRGCRGHRQQGHHGAQRGHRLKAFASGHDRDGLVGSTPEPDGVAKQMAERATGIGNARLAVAIGIEPGALQAGDAPVEVGDGGDQRRQHQRLASGQIAIIATWMKAHRALTRRERNSAAGEVALGERPGDRLCHGEQALSCFRRSGGDGC